jgi:hypothetical protein
MAKPRNEPNESTPSLSHLLLDGWLLQHGAK